MIYIPEVPKTLHSKRERGRLQAEGRCTDDNSYHTLLIINEADGSWVIHGLGASGVRLTRAKMVTLPGEADPGECPVSEPHCRHLLVADDGLAEGHRHGKYPTLCGDLLGASELPSAECSGDCDRAVAYCLGCLRAANEHNWDAGVDVDCPPGVIVRRAR